MHELGKMFLFAGLVLAAAGLLCILAARFPQIGSWLGRLPGDIVIHKKNVTVCIPLATSLLISIILSLLFRVWSRR